MIYNLTINKYGNKPYRFWPSYTLEGMIETIHQIIRENDWTYNDTLFIHERWYYKYGSLYEKTNGNHYEFVVKIKED